LQWRSSAGDDLSWAAPEFDDTSWPQVPLLGSWREQGYDGLDGYVWFRNRLVVDGHSLALARSDQLGIGVGPTIFGGWQLYAGGQLLGQSRGWHGRLPFPAAEAVPVPSAAFAADGTLHLALRVRRIGWASDRARAGSPVGGELVLGDVEALRDRFALEHSRRLLHDVPLLVLAALYLLVASHHFVLFARRRQERTQLWFSLFAGSFAVNTLAISTWMTGLSGSFELAGRLSDASGHAAAAAALQFLWTFFGQPIGRLLRAYQLSHIACGLFVAFWPAFEPVIVSRGIRFLWLVPLLALAVGVLLHHARRGDTDARIMLVGCLVLATVELWQLAVSVLGLPLTSPIPLPPLGFAAVVLAMTTSMSIRFRRVHEQLDRLRVSLEETVEERTRELVAAKEQAESANRLKGQFLANIGHEIRTPMTAVVGLCDLLLSDDPTPLQRRRLEQVHRSGRSLLVLIGDLLDLSKIESGALELTPSPFRVRQLAEDALSLVSPLAEAKGLRVTSDLAKDLPETLRADGQRIAQVLVNLIGNAVKFTDSGSVAVHIDGHDLDGTSYELRCAVSDTGVGIPDDQLGRLFEAFHQVDGSLTRHHEGTGLGLALCRRLVDLMGGELSATSTVGLGSTFEFSIPCEIEAEAPQDEITSAAPREPTSASPHTLRVLVADDHETVREVIEQLLGLLGCEVDLAADGDEAVAAAARAPYEVIIMDVQMPGVSGLDATRRIRALGEGHGRPHIIALTGHATTEDRQRCFEAGVDDYLCKPVRLKHLQEALARVDCTRGRV
jgi:signal transduction histidine kinase/ActR/RegA family two-component response regulator